jgi:hypothetical protein
LQQVPLDLLDTEVRTLLLDALNELPKIELSRIRPYNRMNANATAGPIGSPSPPPVSA